jgi:hypothetical protein
MLNDFAQNLKRRRSRKVQRPDGITPTFRQRLDLVSASIRIHGRRETLTLAVMDRPDCHSHERVRVHRRAPCACRRPLDCAGKQRRQRRLRELELRRPVSDKSTAVTG